MTFNKFCLEIAKREGGKKGTNIAQIREVISHASDIVYESMNGAPSGESEVVNMLYQNGKRRAEDKK